MQDIEQLPLQRWAEQLKQARIGANLAEASLAQTLRLSNAQLRGLESGSLSAFHGPGYYLRAAEKYARELNITLDPPITEMRLTDSQIALNRVKNKPSAANLAKQESLTMGGHTLPGSGRRSSLGIWLAALLLGLIGLGTWLAIGEGWPGGEREQIESQTKSDPITPPRMGADTAQVDQKTLQAPPANRTEPASALELTVQAPATLPTTSPSTSPASPEGTTESVTQAVSTLPSTPSPTLEPTPASAVAPSPAPEPTPPSPPDVIEAQFTADCWVEIRFVDGRVEQGIYKPGQVLSATVGNVERLTFGNAQAVTASRAGKPFDVIAFTRAGNNVARISVSSLPPISPNN